MNELIAEKANTILLNALELMEKGGDFLVGEIPLVIQELLAWNFWESLVCSVLAFVPFVIYGILLKKILPKMDWDEELYIIPLFFGSIVYLCISIGILITHFSLDWLQIAIAPRVWLIEYASTLAN